MDDNAMGETEAWLADAAEAEDEALPFATADSEVPSIVFDTTANDLAMRSEATDRRGAPEDATPLARSALHADRGVSLAERRLPVYPEREALEEPFEQQLTDREPSPRHAAGKPMPQAMAVAEPAEPAVASSEELARDSSDVELDQPAAAPAMAPVDSAGQEAFGMGGMAGGGMGGMGTAMAPMAPGRQELASRARAARVDAELADAPRRELRRSFVAPRIVREYPPWRFEQAMGTAEAAEVDAPVRYWNPVAVADQDGQYRLSFSLPERETTYRLTVDGHGDGRIGSRQTEIVVQKATP